MLLASIAIAIGFVLLIFSADKFIAGAAALANNLGVSPLVIGLTIVGFGTSAPELLVSTIAAWIGNPALAVGNAIGSNITNITLILGCTAVIAPLTVSSRILRHELPLLVLVMLVALALILDGHLGRLDGLLLIAGLAGVMTWLVYDALQSKADEPMTAEYEAEIPHDVPTKRALIWLGSGLAVLLLSSRLLVWGAVEIAHLFGISDLVIGLTIVAIGTSLPELAASVMSARRGEHDIALGNIIGSNMFNILGVLGLPGLIAPLVLPPEVLGRDYPVMLVLTGALFLMAYGLHKARHITRVEGALLLAGFAGYQLWLYLSVTG